MSFSIHEPLCRVLVQHEPFVHLSDRGWSVIGPPHEIPGIEREDGFYLAGGSVGEGIFESSCRESGIVLVIRDKRIPAGDVDVNREIIVLQVNLSEREFCGE